MRIGDWSSDVCSSDLFWLVEAGENGVRQPFLDQERSSCRDESGDCRYGKRRHSLRSWRAVKKPGGSLQWVAHCLSVDPLPEKNSLRRAGVLMHRRFIPSGATIHTGRLCSTRSGRRNLTCPRGTAFISARISTVCRRHGIASPSSGTDSIPSLRSRYNAARARSINVTGVVNVTKSAISISWRTMRDCRTEKQIIEAMRMAARSEEHTSELQSLMRISYAVFCLQKK